MKGQGVLVALALAAVLVGAVLLKGVAREPPSDPTASTDNGAPAGWLALRLFLEEQEVALVVRRSAEEELPEGHALLLVPPPEAAAWRDSEVAEVLHHVREGHLSLLVVCDEDPIRNRRAARLLGGLGVECVPGVGEPGASARGTLPAYAGALVVGGTARVRASGETVAVPAWVDEAGESVVLRRRVGSGWVTVLSSSTVLANDGLARGENAAFLLSLVPPAGVIVDERHHRLRGVEVLERAFDTTGPKVASLALLLLVPFVLLGFAPRRGDPPPAEQGPEPYAARAQVHALAALYRKAGVRPVREAELDPETSARRRSPP